MIRKHSFLLIAVVCYALWISGCSSKDEEKNTAQVKVLKGAQQNSESTDPSNEQKDGSVIPESTEIKPWIYGAAATQNTILRDLKGIWVLKNTGKPYSGTVVFQLEGNIWEERFEEGTKISIRGWDEEKKPIELYSWNMDGTKKNNPSATPINLGE